MHHIFKQFLYLDLCFLMCSVSIAHAKKPGDTFSYPGQKHADSIKPISVGDYLPAINLKFLNLNGQATEYQLSDPGGKLLILDFWATWCGACLVTFPKLDSLQQQFGQNMQVLLVNAKGTGDDKQRIQAYFDKRRNSLGKKYNFPMRMEDTLLVRLFPHKLIPHYIWIKDGVVKAITSFEQVTAENIRSMLNNVSVQLPFKKDIMDFDRNNTLLTNISNIAPEKLLVSSVFVKHISGVFTGAGQSIHADSTWRRIYYINTPLLALYATAIGKPFENRIMLNVRDTSRYIATSQGGTRWVESNTYGYEITLPLSYTREKMNQYMLKDLDRYFNTTGQLEIRKVKCLALVRTNKNNRLLQSKGGTPEVKLLNKELPVKYMINSPLSKLIKALNFQIYGRPLKPIIIDETGFNDPVDLKFKISHIDDLPTLNKLLRPYGLALLEVERELEMFVLTENGYNEN